MKISNNFAILTSNIGYVNSHKTNNNQIKYNHTPNYGDTVSFGHSGTKVINHLGGEFDKETQLVMANIHKNLDELSAYVEKTFTTKKNRYAKLRENYEPLITENKQQAGLKFKIGENKAITVLRNWYNPAFLRIRVEENGKTQHFLLNGVDKAVKNISQNDPHGLPKKPVFMSTEELEASNLKTYIGIANDAVEKYKSYIMNAPTERLKMTTRKFAPNASPIESYNLMNRVNLNAKTNILALFDSENPAQLPKHVKPIQSERNGLLGFSTELDNGSELKVMKRMRTTPSGQEFRYLSLVEQTPDGTKKQINIDLETGKILKNFADGKPIVANGEFHSYSYKEIRAEEIDTQLFNYAKAIFKTTNE